VVNTSAWIQITSALNGSGSNLVSYHVDDNPNPVERTTVILIGDEPFTLTQQPFNCDYTLSPVSRQHGPGAATNSVNVRTSPGCPWNVTTTNSWVNIVSNASGMGSNSVGYAVEANPNPMWRTGILMIADQILTLSQQPVVCNYRLSPSNRVHGFGSTSGSINIIVNGAGCPWIVMNTNDWITFPVMSGTGSATNFAYSITANPRPIDRSGIVMIADQVLTLTQRGTTNGGAFEAIAVLEGGQTMLRLTGTPGMIWELQASSDLISWQTVSHVTNATGTVECIDTPPPSASRRFYRALLE
jgi:hypothetical protein